MSIVTLMECWWKVSIEIQLQNLYYKWKKCGIVLDHSKPEGFHEIQRLCSKNQLIPSLYQMLTIFFVLLVIFFQVFHLTEQLSKITLYEYMSQSCSLHIWFEWLETRIKGRYLRKLHFYTSFSWKVTDLWSSLSPLQRSVSSGACCNGKTE